MTEEELARAITTQRALGRRAVRDLCYDLRVKLWPNCNDDPMYADEFMRRTVYLPSGRLVVV